MEKKEKIGDRGGVSQWRKLESVGEVRRFLAWTVHSMRNGTLDKGEAAIFSQLAVALLKACQESSIEERLVKLEEIIRAKFQS